VSSAAKKVAARGRLSGWALLVGLVALTGVGALPAAGAASDLPTYGGLTDFQTIHVPSDPEEYSWQVVLQEEQELQAIDDQHAAVYYADGIHTAFGITAMQARDSRGISVPTSLAVTEPNIVTLTVHHRAGDPTKDGASFNYPITPGPPFEVGFSTVQIVMPPARPGPESTSSPTAGCLVPYLKEGSLKADRRKLRQAGCTLGKVRGARSRTARVVKQDVEPDTVLPVGARVSVKLGN
jgi:hypothetical protein